MIGELIDKIKELFHYSLLYIPIEIIMYIKPLAIVLIIVTAVICISHMMSRRRPRRHKRPSRRSRVKHTRDVKMDIENATSSLKRRTNATDETREISFGAVANVSKSLDEHEKGDDIDDLFSSDE